MRKFCLLSTIALALVTLLVESATAHHVRRVLAFRRAPHVQQNNVYVGAGGGVPGASFAPGYGCNGGSVGASFAPNYGCNGGSVGASFAPNYGCHGGVSGAGYSQQTFFRDLAPVYRQRTLVERQPVIYQDNVLRQEVPVYRQPTLQVQQAPPQYDQPPCDTCQGPAPTPAPAPGDCGPSPGAGYGYGYGMGVQAGFSPGGYRQRSLYRGY
jgi:hypothetical protein